VSGGGVWHRREILADFVSCWKYHENG
jgi:hypothetical protein